jgi:hypothetical protein
MLELAEKLDVALVYVDQGAAVVHPDTLRRIVPSIRSEEARAVTLAMIQTVERNSWRNFSSNTESRSASVVRITASTDVPRDHIGKKLPDVGVSLCSVFDDDQSMLIPKDL